MIISIENQGIEPGRSCHYNNQCCVGGFKPTAEDMFRTNSPHGLSLTTAYWYGCFYDEEGGNYQYMRNIGPESLHIAYLYVKVPGAVPIIHPEVHNFYRGMGVNRLKGDEIRVHSWRGIPGPGFHMTINPDTAHSVEEDKIDIMGKRLGLGMDVYWPQRDEDAYYSSIMYEAEGVILGKKVKGNMFWDQYYAPPGQNWQTMRFFLEVHFAWVCGILVYDNGDKEMYHTGLGKGQYGWVFASSNEEKITAISRCDKGEIELDDDAYPTRVLYKVEGGDWEWNGLENCHMNPPSQGLPLRWVEGPCKRVNDERKLVFGTGWMESYPGHYV